MAHIVFANVPLLRTCTGGLCPSLTFVQLGSYLKARGHQVELHDASVELDLKCVSMDDTIAHIARRVIEAKPQVLGLSCKVPADGRFSKELVELIKPALPELVVVLGGIWATPCWRGILEQIPGVDGVVLGEGERAIGEICDRLERGEPPFGPEVPGVAFRGPDGPIATPKAPAIPAEALPLLDLSLIPQPDRYTILPFLTSKGCPYGCTFCAERIIFPCYEPTSIERLQQDLDNIQAFGRPYYLWLSDALFGTDPKRVDAIAGMLAKTDFHFLIESRVDVLLPEKLPLLWEAGLEVIYFGLESGSFGTLTRIKKLSGIKAFERYLDRARAHMRACMESDITPIFGVLNPAPGDTMEDLKATYRFMAELAEIAKEACERTGNDPGYHFYAFDYRFIRGTRDFDALDQLAALGATWKQDPDDIFRDVVITDASPTLSRAVADDFHAKIRTLVHSTPKGYERLMRSFPPQPKAGLG